MPRTSLLFLIVWVTASVAFGQTRLDEPTDFDRLEGKNRPPMGGGGSPMVGGGGGAPGYDVTWHPSQSLSSQPGDLGLVRQGLNVGVPLWHSAGGDMLMASVGVRNTLFSTNAILPDTDQ
jgi:hypothetical protein